jgi:hypothetical protein
VFTFALNILCNLCRILLLVFFKILGGYAECMILTGIICLLVYVVLPLYWAFICFILKRSEKPYIDPRFHNTIRLMPDELRYPFDTHCHIRHFAGCCHLQHQKHG